MFNDHSIRETGRSTSVFYRASGIRGYKHQSIKQQNGGLVIRMRHHGREERTKGAAGRFLDDWIRQANASGIRVLQTFAKTLSRYRTGILAWYDHPISTGPLEGANNKIKTHKRQAYGFRDLEYFALTIKE